MGTINTYTAYHATDKINVGSIVKDNFIFHEKNTHWLGSGVYFFLDKTLAISWGNNCPTKKYGSINNPVIIEVSIVLDNDVVCDMRELETYNNVKKAFDVFWQYAYKGHCTVNYDNDFFEKLECAFFNWLTKKWGIKCIICNFQKRRLPIVESKLEDMFNKFCLTYVETQMCIKDVSHIVDRKEIS